jgi:hypothetical protein
MPGVGRWFAHDSRGAAHTQGLRANDARTATLGAGTRNARRRYVANKLEAWTIPLHVIMWTTLLCGLIMVLVVVMMHR